MKVTYVSPNRSHHYPYAEQLAKAGCLHAFVSGYPRFAHNTNPKFLSPFIHRADFLQLIYLLALRLRSPIPLQERLAYLAKCQLDHHAKKAVPGSDLFLFYSGAGLSTLRALREIKAPTHCVVEAVNSHVLYQEALLAEEFKRLKLHFRHFPPYEVKRRVAEYNQADAVLCPSQFVKRSFMEYGIPENSIYVVPYGFTPPPASTHPPYKSDKFIVLYVGQLSVRKGIRYLIQAYQQLKHPKKELWLVGPAANPTGFEDLALEGDIIFWGTQKGEQLANAYQQASVFVQPSIEEGLSLVMAEALSFGCPVIATVNTGAEDLYPDGVGGYHVPIRKPQAISEKLQLLAEDPQILQEQRSKAHSQAQAIGGWKTSGEKLIATLHAIANQEIKST